jgi:sulfotransferase family protein
VSLLDAKAAPVLLTGRGGSGTRLLSQLAEEIGIFIGNRVNETGDSMEWVDLIYRIAEEAVDSLELPSGSRWRREIRARANRIEYLALPRQSRLWGLKLPEIMLVLPLLVDAFPQAKVVHLTRHPVSSSLRRTHVTSMLANPLGAAVLPAAYRYSKREVGSIATDEEYLHNACSWNFQVARVTRYAREALDRESYLEISYEALCTEPSRVVALVRSFLGCPGGGATSIAVEPSRTGSWDADDPRVDMIWDICGETAAFLGYTPEAVGWTRPGAAADRDPESPRTDPG